MGALAQTQPDVAVQNRERSGVSEAQRMETVGRLLSGVAHDFNNLLTGIVLCSDLLLAGLEKESSLRRYAQEIRQEGAQGASMIQHLLSVARGDASEGCQLSLNQTIDGMLKFLKRPLGENIEVVTDLADDLFPVSIDPVEIHQIILNLVLNARDAMPDGGKVTLRTRNRSLHGPAVAGACDLVELEVADTGSDMDQETARRAPEPFFSTKKRGMGTGLGLSTVYSIVKRAGGTVQLDSEPGRGTRICLTFPSASRSGETAKQPANEVLATFKSRKIWNQEEKTRL